MWGAAWLHKATRNPAYLHYIQANGQTLGADEGDNTFGWDNKHVGARILLSKVTFLTTPCLFRPHSICRKQISILCMFSGISCPKGTISPRLQRPCRQLHMFSYPRSSFRFTNSVHPRSSSSSLSFLMKLKKAYLFLSL